MMNWEFEVQGTWAYGAGRLSKMKALRAGMALKLRREPDNPHDANAVEVFRKRSKLGYIPRNVVVEIAPCLDDGWGYEATVISSRQKKSDQGPKYPIIHVEINLIDPASVMGEDDDEGSYTPSKQGVVPTNGKNTVSHKGRSMPAPKKTAAAPVSPPAQWGYGCCPHCNHEVRVRISGKAATVICPSCSGTFFVFP